jgi:Fic family protein
VAVSIAGRTFSTEDGENVLVAEEHVEDAAKYLDNLYSYENFGYRRLSQRIHRNHSIAKKNKRKIKTWLQENPRLLEFLLDRRGSFRAADLEEMAYMQRDEVNHVLGKLADAKMIAKDKSQIVMEPELQALLKEFGR